MFACAHKSASAASNTVKRSAGPGSRPLIASGSWGSRQQLAAPICEGDSFRRGGPLLDQSEQQKYQKSHKEQSGRACRVRKRMCFGQQVLGHTEPERHTAECDQAGDGHAQTHRRARSGRQEECGRSRIDVASAPFTPRADLHVPKPLPFSAPQRPSFSAAGRPQEQPRPYFHRSCLVRP